MEAWILFDEGWTVEAFKLMDIVVKKTVEQGETNYF
jgi:hypothetical protein